ncbi:MAG: hypothetical protein JJU05_00555 [Verrucomicrobia bacterium]|nr:hypothetical protein [Verrucomicrobiota bacterium]
MNLRNNRDTTDSVRLVVPPQDLSVDFSELDELRGTLTDNPPRVEVSMSSFTPEERVVCINPEDRSLIPADATHCPFCGMEQVEGARDSSGDGIPDHLKISWGLDPHDPTDVHQSIDGTGFTVLFQYERGHDPTDPSDYPAHIEFLRVMDVQEETIRFEFRGFTQIAENVFMVQMRIRYPDQNDWQTVRVRAGEDPTGQNRNRFGRNNEFSADRFVQTGEMVDGRFVDQSYVMISGARTPFRLYRDGDRSRHSVVNRTARLHLYMGPEWSKTVRPDESFDLDNKTYKVVDIHAETVVIAERDSDSQLTIRSATSAELEEAAPPEEEPVDGFEDGDSFLVDPGMFF